MYIDSYLPLLNFELYQKLAQAETENRQSIPKHNQREWICRLNIHRDVWEKEAPMIHARHSHGMVNAGNLIFVAGGEESTLVSVTLWIWSRGSFFSGISHRTQPAADWVWIIINIHFQETVEQVLLPLLRCSIQTQSSGQRLLTWVMLGEQTSTITPYISIELVFRSPFVLVQQFTFLQSEWSEKLSKK